MQEPNGNLRQIDIEEAAETPWPLTRKIVSKGQPFKIKGCYFVVTDIDSNSIRAKSITRKEYYQAKRNSSL